MEPDTDALALTETFRLAVMLPAPDSVVATQAAPPAPTSPMAWKALSVSPASVVIGPLIASVWLNAVPMSPENCW